MYTIKYEPYLDVIDDKSYKNIVTINRVPDGPLQSCVVKVSRNKLSTLSGPHRRSSCESQCLYVITQNIYNIVEERSPCDCPCGSRGSGRGAAVGVGCGCEYLCVDQIPDLLEIAVENKYSIDYKLSKLLSNTGVGSSNTAGSKFICTLSYNQ